MSGPWVPPVGPSEELAGAVIPTLRIKFKAGVDATGHDDLGIDFDWADPKAIEYAEQRGAELVGRRRAPDGTLIPNPHAEWAIEETTRQEVNALVTRAVSKGWSISQFKRELEESGLFESDRAELIARTELGLAQNAGRLASYREAEVEYVVVQDANECETDVCDVDGEVWTVDEADAEPLGHPNCTRSFRPATRDEVAEEEAAQLEDEEAA
jgi:hypothetical protein